VNSRTNRVVRTKSSPSSEVQSLLFRWQVSTSIQRGVRCATRRFHAKLASQAQTRSHYVIRSSDAATQFEIAISDIAYLLPVKGPLQLSSAHRSATRLLADCWQFVVPPRSCGFNLHVIDTLAQRSPCVLQFGSLRAYAFTNTLSDDDSMAARLSSSR
jgi:hypothetical protein